MNPNELDIKDWSVAAEWVNSLPYQTDGKKATLSETGEPYVEMFSIVPCRPDDVKVAERVVATVFARQLWSYLSSKSDGAIYWRVRPEFGVWPHQEVVSFDDAAPDYDAWTGKRCVMDRNWVIVKAYCRVLKTDKSPMDREIAA
jgi:hypothetical protein